MLSFHLTEVFHMLGLTVLHDIMRTCLVETAISLSMAKKSPTEHHNGRTVGADRTNVLLLAVSTTIRKLIRAKTSGRKSCL